MSNNIFQDIIDKKIPADIVYEDELAIAFKDISPQAPVHILVIPKKQISKLSDSTNQDQELLGHLLLVVKKITTDENILDYRVAINNGAEVLLTVFHLDLAYFKRVTKISISSVYVLDKIRRGTLRYNFTIMNYCSSIYTC